MPTKEFQFYLLVLSEQQPGSALFMACLAGMAGTTPSGMAVHLARHFFLDSNASCQLLAYSQTFSLVFHHILSNSYYTARGVPKQSL